MSCVPTSQGFPLTAFIFGGQGFNRDLGRHRHSRRRGSIYSHAGFIRLGAVLPGLWPFLVSVLNTVNLLADHLFSMKMDFYIDLFRFQPLRKLGALYWVDGTLCPHPNRGGYVGLKQGDCWVLRKREVISEAFVIMHSRPASSQSDGGIPEDMQGTKN